MLGGGPLASGTAMTRGSDQGGTGVLMRRSGSQSAAARGRQAAPGAPNSRILAGQPCTSAATLASRSAHHPVRTPSVPARPARVVDSRPSEEGQMDSTCLPEMPRRTFMVIIAGGLVAAPLAAEAQPAGKVARIGFLGLNPGAKLHLRGAFLQGLRDLGYVEGRNVAIEYRSAEGKLERLSALAAELVALKVDVIVTGGGTPTALAAKQATRTLPIVFSSATDPVTDGLITSLARPGGEHTDKDMLQGAEVAARALGVRLQFVKARGPADFDSGFSDMIRRAGALAVWLSAPPAP